MNVHVPHIDFDTPTGNPLVATRHGYGLMPLNRRRPRPVVIISQRCRKCGRARTVVEDSATARQRICNLCVSAEVSRAERTQVDLDAVR